MEKMLVPEVVAIAVHPEVPKESWQPVLESLVAGGYEGRILLVGEGLPTRKGSELYANLSLVRSTIDLCLLFCPGEKMLEAVEEAMKSHARSLVLMGTRAEGKPATEQIVGLKKLCSEHRGRIIGPGSMGIANTHHNLQASSFGSPMPSGSIAFISQSGTLCSMMAGWASHAGTGISRMVDLGEGVDLDENTWLEQLANDEQTKVITCYLESIASGDHFMRSAEMAASKKPVVVLKAGTTSTGSEEAAALRSSELLGGDLAYVAAFERAGVIRASNFDELTDFTLALNYQHLPEGPRTGLISSHGGSSILAADAIEAAELKLSSVRRIDQSATSNEDRFGHYRDAIISMELDRDVDAIIISLTPHWGHDPLQAASFLASLRRDFSKPLLVALMECEGSREARTILVGAGIPAYPSIGRAVASMGALWKYSAWRSRPPRIVTHFPVNKRRVERIVSRHLRSELIEIGEYPTKEILSAYGFNIPDNILATSSDEAVEAAERLGFPVCLKIVSPDILSKSPVDGVKLNLYTSNQVLDAFDLILLRARKKMPSSRIEGICVERMVHRGRDVTLGMSRDPRFGPMLAFGLGSAFVEVMKDVAFHLAPISAPEAMLMLKQTSHFDSLSSSDDSAPMNVDAIAAGLQRLSQLATDFPGIVRIEINPFRVGRLDSDAVVVDAGMALKKPR